MRAPLFHQYSINGKPIARLDEERGLGVRINSKLSWPSQVASQISAANKSLGRVRRSVIVKLMALKFVEFYI